MSRARQELTFDQYILLEEVAHDRKEIEVVCREPDGSWSRHVSEGKKAARVESLDCELAVDEIYRDPLTSAG